MKTQWITFDLDGTLMQNPFGSWVFPEIDKIVKEQTSFRDDFRTLLISEHQKRMRENLIVEAYDWDGIVRDILISEELTLTINIEELVIKHSISPKIYLLEEGIPDILKQLKKKGYALAAVTNGYSNYQLPVLDALRLSPFFDVIITPEKVGYGKPNIQMVESLMNSDHNIVAHVGDRIDHDIVFANELGVPSVLVYKDMPQSLKKINPTERKETDQCFRYCKYKWQKETNIDPINFTPKHLPKIVIHSIDELVDCL